MTKKIGSKKQSLKSPKIFYTIRCEVNTDESINLLSETSSDSSNKGIFDLDSDNDDI